MNAIIGAGYGFMAGIAISILLIMDLGASVFTNNPFASWFLIEAICIAIGGVIGAMTGKRTTATS